MAKFAMAIALSMIVGCAASADAPSSDPAETPAAETTSTASEQLTLTPPIKPAIACSGSGRVCLTGFNCHHEEGLNIGVLGCTGGKICCQF